MKTFIISTIFMVLSTQAAMADSLQVNCTYQGTDGGSAVLQSDNGFDFEGTQIIIGNDESRQELPLTGVTSVGEKDGELVYMLAWHTFLRTYVVALPATAEGRVSVPVYRLDSFNEQGPVTKESGFLVCHM